jgi:hypothetical protein
MAMPSAMMDCLPMVELLVQRQHHLLGTGQPALPFPWWGFGQG